MRELSTEYTSTCTEYEYPYSSHERDSHRGAIARLVASVHEARESDRQEQQHRCHENDQRKKGRRDINWTCKKREACGTNDTPRTRHCSHATNTKNDAFYTQRNKSKLTSTQQRTRKLLRRTEREN